MATTVSMGRQPFGELSSSRVQQLNSAKNRQNGVLAKSSPLSGKPLSAYSPVKTAGKRAYTLSTYDDADSENADPSLFSPTKKSKSDLGDKSFTFSITPVKSMPPPLLPARTPARTNNSSPRAPLTAPAGRSPPRKIAGISKSRRGSAPFTRINPPFSSRGSSSLPFSLDAAISGSMSVASLPTKDRSAGSTIQESVPASWDFEIYEDSPEEEAANLMEHSTQSLNLSFDDVTAKAERDDRGKENEAPQGYDAPTASRRSTTVNEPVLPAPTRVKKTELTRRKIVEMDDGERSPLSDLETDEFIPEGLTKDAHIVLEASPEKFKLDVNSLFAVPPPPATPSPMLETESNKSSQPAISSNLYRQDGITDTIIIWEDNVNVAEVDTKIEGISTPKEDPVADSASEELNVIA